jgi:hypothetical protein
MMVISGLLLVYSALIVPIQVPPLSSASSLRFLLLIKHTLAGSSAVGQYQLNGDAPAHTLLAFLLV